MAETAVEIVRRVQAGQLSPVDAVAAALDRIDRDDARIGAFQVVRRERALADAHALLARAGPTGLANLPLAGLPVAVKDNLPIAGEPMRKGSAATHGRPEPVDHEVVRLLRAAGAILVGSTRMPEFGVFATTDSVFGVTRNPWDPNRTPGGSSGGSAVAVAAGLVPVAVGNDGLGSIRIPAACCGIFGIKPGSRLVPARMGPTDWYGLVENGPLATTAADAALVLAVLSGRPELAAVQEPAWPLRLAVSVRPPLPGVVVDREHQRAVFRAARLLERAGHTVSRVNPPHPGPATLATIARWLAGAADEADLVDSRRLERRNRVHAMLGRLARPTIRIAQAEAWRRRAGDFFTGYDALLVPVLATPPIAADRWGERGWLANVVANVRFAPFAAAWNLAGFPAASVPAGRHPTTGTPLSVQVVAPPAGESRLLGLAAQLERLTP
jgi:amidase